MNLLNMTYHNIDRGLAALTNLGTALGIPIVGYPPEFFQRVNAEDVEMNVFNSDAEISLLDALDSGPSNLQRAPIAVYRPIYLATIVDYIRGFHFPVIQRPRFLREMRESTSTLIQLVFLLVVLWTWLMQIIGVPTASTLEYRWDKPLIKSSELINPNSQQTLQAGTNHHYVPGFYIVPDALQYEQHEHAEVTPTISIDTVSKKPSTVVKRSSDNDHSTFTKCVNVDNAGPYHRAYPLRAGTAEKSDLKHSHRLKLELERCAINLFTRLDSQELFPTATFEFVLQDCKAAIDAALATLYPSLDDLPTGLELPPQDTIVNYGVFRHVDRLFRRSMVVILQPQVGVSVSSNVELVEPVEPTVYPHVKRNSRSEGFCNRISSGNLDRCYLRDETEYQNTGKTTYLNDSVDDFKDDAPLDCNLCLPVIDEEGIKVHCEEIKAAEKSLFQVLVIIACVLGSLAMIGVLGKAGWRKY